MWELLVRTIKTALRKVLGERAMSFEELTTVLTKAEAIVNSRPVTFIIASADEPTAISPAHFLVGQSWIVFPERPPATGMPTSASRQHTLRKHEYRQKRTYLFWKRWRSECFLQLRSAHCHPNMASTFNLKVDGSAFGHWWMHEVLLAARASCGSLSR